MGRLAAPLVVSLLLAFLLVAALPGSSAAIQVTIEDETLLGTDTAPDGLPRLRSEPDGRPSFVVEGTFGNFRVDGCCGQPARVIVEDGDSVDQLTFTDARIAPLSGADLEFTMSFGTTEGDLTAIDPGQYEHAAAMDGAFSRPVAVDRFRRGPIGDVLEVTGFGNGAVISDPPGSSPTFTHTVENLVTAPFVTMARTFLDLVCETSLQCPPSLGAAITIGFTTPSDSLTLVGSMNVLGANLKGTAGTQALDQALGGLGSATTANNPTRPGSVIVFSEFVRGTVVVGMQNPACSDVMVQKMTPTPVIIVGEAGIVDIKVTANTAATNITLSDPLPSTGGTTWALVAPVAGCSLVGDLLSCSFGSLGAGEMRTVSVRATTSAAACDPAMPGFRLDSTATVTATGDTNPANNMSSASITVVCPGVNVVDVTVVKTTPTPSVNAGQNAVFDITVTASSAANNVTLSDPLPDTGGTTWALVAPVGGCSLVGNLLSCDFGSLAPGEMRTVSVTATASAAGCSPQTLAYHLDNTATVTAMGDINQTNNMSSASITVFCAGGPVCQSTPILEPRSSFAISVTSPPAANSSGSGGGGSSGTSESGAAREGQPVKLLARWVCPGSQDPASKFVCKELDFELRTRVKGTLVFNPESVGTMALPPVHPPIPRPPCNRGYLIAWVVSPDDAGTPRPIKFDGLVGAAVVRNGENSAAVYRGLAIQAVSGLATGAVTDANGDGRLQFDGVTEYRALPGQLRGSVRYERTVRPPRTTLGTIETSLTLLTLGVISNRPNFPTVVDLHFFDENEALLSASHEFICWSKVRLTGIDANLDQFFGVKGLFETTEAEKVAIFGVEDAAGPVPLVGLVSTIERRRDGTATREYGYPLFNDGRTVPTIFEPH